jgi:hypothetical protein
MKARLTLFTLVFCVLTAVAGFAADMTLGTWKLNEAKSKIPAGVSKNVTVVYTADGDNLKAVLDGVDGSGNPTHSEWIGKFDGKDYPVTGDPSVDSRSITEVDAHHFKVATKKDGKIAHTGTIVISPNGKTRTLSVHAAGPDGKQVAAVFVYHRQ